MDNGKTKAWLYAFRLRTLPLAFSAIVMGSFACYQEHFDGMVFGLALLTTLLLQVLSNLANDYGDSEKGADNAARIGPPRAVQAGLLTTSEIMRGIRICSILAIVSGLTLVAVSLHSEACIAVGFVALGLAAVGAAIKYTVGRGAYGYRGYGDLAVMVFFGGVGVGGSSFLQIHQWHWSIILPAWTIGAFATGVLNLNNMRDRVGDERAGKNTIVVKMGADKAKWYHYCLILTGWYAALGYVFIHFHSGIQLLVVIAAPLFWKNILAVYRITEPRDYDPLLKQLAIATFIFALLFAIGQVVAG